MIYKMMLRITILILHSLNENGYMQLMLHIMHCSVFFAVYRTILHLTQNGYAWPSCIEHQPFYKYLWCKIFSSCFISGLTEVIFKQTLFRI